MKAIDFPQRNVLIAKDQDDFMTLPAYVSQSGDGLPTRVISKFKLDDEEQNQVAEAGEIYLCTITGGQPLQPISASIINPFKPHSGKDGPTDTEFVLIAPNSVPKIEMLDSFQSLPSEAFVIPSTLFYAIWKQYEEAIKSNEPVVLKSINLEEEAKIANSVPGGSYQSKPFDPEEDEEEFEK